MPNGAVIHWFRRDLRIADNKGLYHASKTGPLTVPVYFLSDWRGKHDWTAQYEPTLRQQLKVVGLVREAHRVAGEGHRDRGHQFHSLRRQARRGEGDERIVPALEGVRAVEAGVFQFACHGAHGHGVEHQARVDLQCTCMHVGHSIQSGQSALSCARHAGGRRSM